MRVALHVMLMVGLLVDRAVADEAHAERLFRDGKQLLEAGHVTAACAAFEASQAAGPATSTLFNLANCHEKAERFATAWQEYLVVARTGADESTRTVAQARADALESSLSMISVIIHDPPQGLAVTLDDAVLAPGAWERELPVDGGLHRLKVEAPGFLSWSREITVGVRGDRQRIEAPALRPESTAARPARLAVEIGVGFGGRDFANDQGIDHWGWTLSVAPRLTVATQARGRVVWAVGATLRWQRLRKELGAGVVSQATVGALTLDATVRVGLHSLPLSVRAGSSLGAAYYSAPGANDGSSGAQWHENPLLMPLADFGARLAVSAGLCVRAGWLCVDGTAVADVAVNPDPVTTDGNSPASGLSPRGVEIDLTFDVLRLSR